MTDPENHRKRVKKDKSSSSSSKKPEINPQMKAYLESLRGWIQRNAKSKEEAWKIFWKSYKDQQKALPTWKDSEEATHMKTARWWFDQAFKKINKFNPKNSTKKYYYQF